MTDMHTRFRALDNLRAPDLWNEIEERAMAMQPTTRRSNPWVLIAVTLLLLVAIAGVALVGSGLLKLPMTVEASPTPSASTSAVPSATGSAAPSPTDAAVAASWSATGDMIEAHSGTATLLADGRVLVAGGTTGEGTLSGIAQVYDPGTGAWTATGSLLEARAGHTATLLDDGRVLVAGGGTDRIGDSSAEVYDPASGTWSATGGMAGFRQSHVAVLLPDGTVLVAGGDNVPGGDCPVPLASAELYDPEAGTWRTTGSMVETRIGMSATMLSNGTVLVAGGYGVLDCVPVGHASAELYDPDAGAWTATGDLIEGRSGHAATLLSDGSVLVAGGSAFGTGQLASAELYDPATGSWSATGGMNNALFRPLTLLPDGTVLAAGGGDLSGENLSASAELYDPTSGSWTATASMAAARSGHTATLLADGTVLVAGGNDNLGSLTSSELYHPGGG
jgi:hypothetical protein